MANKQKPDGNGQPDVEGADDARVHAGDDRNQWSKGEEDYPGGGVNGPVKRDRDDYHTHYGETAYGGGQKRYGDQEPHFDQTVHGGQQGVHAPDAEKDPGFFSGKGHSDNQGHEVDSAVREHREGAAGSRGMIPGAGADKGPPDGK